MKRTRLFPLAAALSTIVLVAACARHEKNPKISAETMQDQAIKSLRATYGNVDIYDEKNMKFAAEIEGADLTLKREVDKNSEGNTRSLDVIVTVLLKNHETAIEGKGIVSSEGQGALEIDGESQYTMSAKCVAKDCANVVVELVRLDEKPTTVALNVNEANKAASENAQGEQGPDASQLVGVTPTQNTNLAADGTEATEAPAPVPSTPVLTPNAKTYLQFRIPLKEGKAKEDAKVRELRQSSFSLFWSMPTEKGKIQSGTTKSAAAALAERKGQKPSPTPAEPTAPPAQGEESGDTAVTNDSTKTPPAPTNSPEPSQSPAPTDSPAPSAGTQGSPQDEIVVIASALGPETIAHNKKAEELEAKAKNEKDPKKKDALLAEAAKERKAAVEAQSKWIDEQAKKSKK